MNRDKKVNCLKCHRIFVFSVAEQKLFHRLGLSKEPKHCQECRLQDIEGSSAPTKQTSCTRCQKVTPIPFPATGDKPVYCSSCFMDNLLEKWYKPFNCMQAHTP
jgi:CxxC-x17-CxxC domain-containing protein